MLGFRCIFVSDNKYSLDLYVGVIRKCFHLKNVINFICFLWYSKHDLTCFWPDISNVAMQKKNAWCLYNKLMKYIKKTNQLGNTKFVSYWKSSRRSLSWKWIYRKTYHASSRNINEKRNKDEPTRFYKMWKCLWNNLISKIHKEIFKYF